MLYPAQPEAAHPVRRWSLPGGADALNLRSSAVPFIPRAPDINKSPYIKTNSFIFAVFAVVLKLKFCAPLSSARLHWRSLAGSEPTQFHTL